MTDLPATYDARTAPRVIIQLAEMIVPQLLAGEHRSLETLRVQYEHARITTVELTGLGFFVNYEVPEGLPTARPSDFAGGNAAIEIVGLESPAGCVLFVREGRLAMFEVFIYDNEWPQDVVVQRVANVTPLVPPP